MIELKPCPFCGSKNIEIFDKYHPECKDCGCTQNKIIGKKALDTWNSRAEESKLAAITAECIDIGHNHVSNTIDEYNEKLIIKEAKIAKQQEEINDYKNILIKLSKEGCGWHNDMRIASVLKKHNKGE